MVLCTYGGLRTIWVSREELCHERLVQLAEVLCYTDVVFLVYSLQLSMEAANHHVLEAVGLYFSPVFYLIAWYVLSIACDVIRSICVSALSSDGSHQFVILVRYEVLGSDLADAVNLMILLLALFSVGDEAILFISCLYFVEQWCLGSRIVGAKFICTLEHQVLQIVSQTRGFRRIVLATCTNSNESLNTWLLLVD